MFPFNLCSTPGCIFVCAELYHHLGARFRKALGHGPTDPGSSASHDGCLVIKRETLLNWSSIRVPYCLMNEVTSVEHIESRGDQKDNAGYGGVN